MWANDHVVVGIKERYWRQASFMHSPQFAFVFVSSAIIIFFFCCSMNENSSRMEIESAFWRTAKKNIFLTKMSNSYLNVPPFFLHTKMLTTTSKTTLLSKFLLLDWDSERESEQKNHMREWIPNHHCHKYTQTHTHTSRKREHERKSNKVTNEVCTKIIYL